jgi:hypothetical protein
MDRIKVKLLNPQQARAVMTETVLPAIKAHLIAGTQLVLEVRGMTRTTEQNAMLHSILRDLSEQVTWFDRKLSPDGWKHLLTGHLAGVELVPNLEQNGFISLTKGKPTSSMTKREMSDLFELAWSFGADKGVKWSPTSQGRLTHEQ